MHSDRGSFRKKNVLKYSVAVGTLCGYTVAKLSMVAQIIVISMKHNEKSSRIIITYIFSAKFLTCFLRISTCY